MPEYVSQVKYAFLPPNYVPQEGPEENSFMKAVIKHL